MDSNLGRALGIYYTIVPCNIVGVVLVSQLGNRTRVVQANTLQYSAILGNTLL